MAEPTPQLSQETRDALTDELFALHHIAEPDKDICILAGDDADLISAVEEMRDRVDAMPDPEPEPGDH